MFYSLVEKVKPKIIGTIYLKQKLTGSRTPMSVEQPPGNEPFGANVTHVRPFARMATHVDLQRRSLREPPVAHFTDKRSLVRMRPFVTD